MFGAFQVLEQIEPRSSVSQGSQVRGFRGYQKRKCRLKTEARQMAHDTRELVFNFLWSYVKRKVRNIFHIVKTILSHELTKLQSAVTRRNRSIRTENY